MNRRSIPAWSPVRTVLPAALCLALAAGCGGDGDAGGSGSEPAASRESGPAGEEARTGQSGGAEAKGDAADADAPLLNPGSPEMSETAPDTFRVSFRTSEGRFLVEVRRSWAPRGADRFYNLVRHGFYDGVRFFRVLEGFVAQFGISGDPRISRAWEDATIADDPVRHENVRSTLSFATSGPDSRTTQVFVNLGDNRRLDGMGFAPFGRVVEGMGVVESLYAGYGEGAPRGRGPRQDRIQSEGNEYLKAEFPELDYVEQARIVSSSSSSG